MSIKRCKLLFSHIEVPTLQSGFVFSISLPEGLDKGKSTITYLYIRYFFLLSVPHFIFLSVLESLCLGKLTCSEEMQFFQISLSL